MKTIWKNIRGYTGYYQVSNTGKVRSMPRPTTSGGILKPHFNKFTGYYSVILCKNGKTKRIAIHILVAKAFVKGYKKGLQVNHKDCNKANNDDWNLEWSTPKQNTNHAIKKGRMWYKKIRI